MPRGGARPALGDALPSALARCVTAQGTVLLPVPPFFLSVFPGRRSAARECAGCGAAVAQAGRCHSPGGKGWGDLIARHAPLSPRSAAAAVRARRQGAMLSGTARGDGLRAPRAASLSSARLWALPRRARCGGDSRVCRGCLCFGRHRLCGEALARSEPCSALAASGAGYLLNPSVFKWITWL